MAAQVPPLALPAAVAVEVKPEEKKVRSSFGDALSATTRRSAIIDYWLAGNIVGNPDLLPVRFVETSVTHDAYAKMDFSRDQPGTLAYYDSDCYLLPKDISPRDDSKVGGGPTGVIKYHFGTVKSKPGCYMIMAAAEDAITKFLASVLAHMEARVSSAKKQTGHVLNWDYIENALQAPKNGFERFVAGFAEEWNKKVTWRDVQSKKGDDSISRKWNPLAVEWPKAQVTSTMRTVIEKIVDNRRASMSKRGLDLYNRMVAEGKFKPKSARPKEDAKPKDTKAKKRAPPPRSALDVAVAADNKKEKELNGTPKKIKVWEKEFAIDDYMTQKTFIDFILEKIPGSKALVAKKPAKVRRFIDDLYIRLLTAMAEVAVQFMESAQTTTMSGGIARRAIKTFFLAISGGAQSDIQRDAVGAAVDMNNDYIHKKNKTVEEKPDAPVAKEDPKPVEVPK